ncbi:putative general stress protein [Bacillus subtilis]|nr:putative general stress protein [Bacillus subtilis]
MSKDGINSKDFLIGTLIGGIIGATTALFLAPKSGKELRDDLGSQAVALRDKTDKMTADAKEKGTQYVSIAKDKNFQHHTACSGSVWTDHEQGKGFERPFQI